MSHLNIPIWLIIAAWVIYPLAGIILTVLRIISDKQKKNASNSQNWSVKSNNTAQNHTRTNIVDTEHKASSGKYTYNYTYTYDQNKTAGHDGYNPAGKKDDIPAYRNSGVQHSTPVSQQDNIIKTSTDNTGSGNTVNSSNSTNEYYLRQQEKLAKKKLKRKPSGAYTTLLTFGIISTVFTALAGLGIFTGATGLLLLQEILAVFLPMSMATAGCYIGAHLVKKRDIRYARIKIILDSRESFNLAKLASICDSDVKQIKRDVQKMIDKGEFGEKAYIDLATNNFMSNPDAKPDDVEHYSYTQNYEIFGTQDKRDSTEKTPDDGTDESRFRKIIHEIRRLNDEIADEAVSAKIDAIEERTKNIFDYVTDHPEAMPQIRTFMNYYLPTTLKLLESYSRIEKVGVAGENMKKSKESIEQILDVLTVGFEQQVDQLFRNETIDITSDISVLETMMQKDGLNGKSDFSKSEFDSYSDDITDDIGDGLNGGTAGMKK